MIKQLDLEEQYPVVVTCSFNNSFTEMADGRQQIIVGWEQPQLEYNLSKAKMDEVQLKSLLQFFEETSSEVFLYKDPSDFLVTSFAYEPKPGVATWGQLLPLSPTDWQLCKVYEVGGYRSIRPISRPNEVQINSTVTYLLNDTTGIIQFSSAVNIQTEIFWEGSFFVPVVLENQDISYKIESNEPQFSLPEFRFKELREIARSFAAEIRPQYLDGTLDLDLIVGSIFTYSKKISNVYTDSGWYKDLPLWERPRVKITTAEKTIADEEELEAAIALYRVTCGGAIGFNYQEKSVRIDKSPLVITVESKFNFGIGSLELIQTGEVFGLDRIDAQTYVVPIVQSTAVDPEFLQAITNFRSLLKHRIFGDDEELTARYFQSTDIIPPTADQRWLRWLTQDYRQNLGEPDKVAFIVYINSLSPFYDSPLEIATEYFSDAVDFIASKASRESFAAVIYAPGPSLYGAGVPVDLQNHLKNAYEGTNDYGYPLKSYGLQIRPVIPTTLISLSKEFYLADLTSALTDFNFLSLENNVNFVARCWQFEQQTISPQSIDLTSNFRDQRVLPLLQYISETSYDVHLFGTYISTRIADQGAPRKHWRTRVPVRGLKILRYRREVLGIPLFSAIYFDRVVVDIGNGQQTDLVHLTPTEYSNLTFNSFPNHTSMFRYDVNGSQYLENLVNQKNGRPAKDFLITHAMRINGIASGDYTPAPFEKGQCQGVSYRFIARYGNGEWTQFTAPIHNVSGPISDIHVYFQSNQSLGVQIYNLSVLANGVRKDGIELKDQNGNALTFGTSPLGIYNIIAGRVDNQPDLCGNYYDNNFIQPTASLPRTVGFTNHDTAITFNNTEFLPSYGGNPQARSHNGDLESSNNTETNFILGDLFSYEDLVDGVWSGAKFTEWMVDWNNPANQIKLATGYIGRLTLESSHEGGLSCKLEMRSLLARLQQKNYYLTVEQCPKTFGKDGAGNCRKNLYGLIDQLQVTEVIDPVTFKINSTRTVNNFYGQVTFLNGNRQNLSRLIDSYDSATKIIKLRSSLSGIVVGDTLNAVARCDKTLKACLDFNNAANFGGFWHVPGVDKVARTDR